MNEMIDIHRYYEMMKIIFKKYLFVFIIFHIRLGRFKVQKIQLIYRTMDYLICRPKQKNKSKNQY